MVRNYDVKSKCDVTSSIRDILLVCTLFKSFNARTECIIVKEIVRGHNIIQKSVQKCPLKSIFGTGTQLDVNTLLYM